MAILGIDVGGTFTDAVLLADGELGGAKLSTQPHLLAAVLDTERRKPVPMPTAPDNGRRSPCKPPPRRRRSAARAEALRRTFAEGGVAP